MQKKKEKTMQKKMQRIENHMNLIREYPHDPPLIISLLFVFCFYFKRRFQSIDDYVQQQICNIHKK